MKYVLFDESESRYVAMAKKVTKVGYSHIFDLYIEYTYLLREAQQFSKKESEKWAKLIENVVLIAV